MADVGKTGAPIPQQSKGQFSAKAVRQVTVDLPKAVAKVTSSVSSQAGDLRGAESTAMEEFIAADHNQLEQPPEPNTKALKKIEQRKAQHAQEQHQQANRDASALIALIIKQSKVKVLGEQKQAQQNGQTQDQVQEQLLEKAIKDPNSPLVVKSLVVKMQEKMTELKKKAQAGDAEAAREFEQVAQIDALIDALLIGETKEGVSVSHQALVEFMQGIPKPDINANKELKALIGNYNDSLAKVVLAEEAAGRLLDAEGRAPLKVNGVLPKGDKAQRTFLAKLGSVLTDTKGGIFNYTDTEVNWNLTPFEYDGDLSIRRLLANGNEGSAYGTKFKITPGQTSYPSVALNEKNPTYSFAAVT